MAKLTICLGVLLILLGILGFVSDRSHSGAILIPAAIGFLLSILGMFSFTEDAKKRMLFMHIAVTIGLIGFLGFAWNIVKYIEMIRGRQFLNPIAIDEYAATAAILLFFVLLCIRSFILARRTRS